MNDVSRLSADPTIRQHGFFLGHPIGFWFIFSGELAERASFYGMKAILTLYMIDKLGFTKAEATTRMSLFMAGAYFLPLVGGYVADRFFGKYWTIVGFSIPYILGHVILGVEDRWYLYTALVLLAMGSGVIKPNISTLMGMTYDQQCPGQEKLRSAAFAIFYAAINIGAFASTTVMPELRDRFDYWVAFLFPAALMVFAFAFFAAGKRFYAVEVIRRTPISPEERAEQWAVLRQLFGLFFLVMFFWAIFDQHATTWIYFAREHLDLHVFGYEVKPDQIQAINPLLIVALLPVISALWTALERGGVRLRATDKMTIGFLLTALTMALHALAGYLAETGNTKVTVWWQIAAFVTITVAEIMISVTGLELAFTAAPARMKSFVTACWLLTVGFANLFLIAPVGRLYPDRSSPGWHFETTYGYFSMLTVALLVVTGAFVLVARRFNQVLKAGPRRDRVVESTLDTSVEA
ncbi:MAG: oligopeptide:H+ symporter [Gemmataceae bacterium]|nr:oligopeptide:H+ symporter [Gemmataceae bacterium]MDW8263791.1 oligopeptide:H+ symporter [Gemmataceae bacterium]